MAGRGSGRGADGSAGPARERGAGGGEWSGAERCGVPPAGRRHGGVPAARSEPPGEWLRPACPQPHWPPAAPAVPRPGLRALCLGLVAGGAGASCCPVVIAE